MSVTKEQRKEITRISRAIRGAEDSAEVSAATVAVLFSGALNMAGIVATPEMIAAGSALLASLGSRISRGVL